MVLSFFFQDYFYLNQMFSPVSTETLPHHNMLDYTMLNYWNRTFIIQSFSGLSSHIQSLTIRMFKFGFICFQYIVPLFHCPIVMLLSTCNCFFCLFTFPKRDFLMVIHPLNLTDLNRLFKVESDSNSCREVLCLAVNSEVVFLLCLLLSKIKYLYSAAFVTFGTPTLSLICALISL